MIAYAAYCLRRVYYGIYYSEMSAKDMTKRNSYDNYHNTRPSESETTEILDCLR